MAHDLCQDDDCPCYDAGQQSMRLEFGEARRDLTEALRSMLATLELRDGKDAHKRTPGWAACKEPTPGAYC